MPLGDLAEFHECERLDQRFRAHRREPLGEIACGLVGRDARALFEQHRARVELIDHAHDGDAGLFVAGEHRGLDGRRAAPARKQRRMDVERAELRQRDDLAREDVAVGHDDAEVRLARAKRGDERLAARTLGLQDGNPVGERDFLHGARHQRRTRAALRTVGLRDHRSHVVSFTRQREKRRGREFRGAPEDDPQGCLELVLSRVR